MENRLSILRNKNLRLLYSSAILFLGILSACQTTEEPAEVSQKNLQPFSDKLAGTTWIVRDSSEIKNKEFPGYRGFHLRKDGRLLLINFDTAVGDSWSAENNLLQMSLMEGKPEISIEGIFRTYTIERKESRKSSQTKIQELRLVNQNAPGSENLIFEQAGRNVGIVENHWTPKKMLGGESVRWPSDREIHIILLPDATGGLGILGYGGENRFHGQALLDSVEFRIGPISITRKIGPESQFEDLFVQRIDETTHFVQVDDDLFLYKGTQPTASFRVLLFG